MNSKNYNTYLLGIELEETTVKMIKTRHATKPNKSKIFRKLNKKITIYRLYKIEITKDRFTSNFVLGNYLPSTVYSKKSGILRIVSFLLSSTFPSGIYNVYHIK